MQGLALGAARPLIMDKSFVRIRNEKLEMRNGGMAHKNIEAPRSIDAADVRLRC